MGDLVRLPYNPSVEMTQQLADFWKQEMQQAALSPHTIMERVTERTRMLSEPHGKDTICQDENGIIVPLHILHERIIGSRAFMSVLNGGFLPEGLSKVKGVKLAESISRTQSTLRVIMDQFDPVVRFDIVVSIDILCHTLAKIIRETRGENLELRSPSFMRQFEKIMIARNWCPSRISQLANAVNTPIGYIASLLPSYESSPHGGCNPRKCFKRPSTLQTMPRSHRQDCNENCSLVTILESKLIKMLTEGGIPGLRLVNNCTVENIEIVDCTQQPFIAISHVWSHGLGNDKINELPSCQLHSLFNSIKRLGGDDVILWIDTLCVPATDQEAKRLAILKLRQVYSEASKVLVIDKHLMQVGSDPTEQIMQLLGSEWQRRLWTLQEGRLARELFIQFREGAVSISELTSQRPLLQSSDANAGVFDFSLLLKADVESRFSSIQDPQSHFTALVEDLSQRSVTVKTDEPICLATLLGLSLENYDPYPTMVDIYRSLPNIPSDLMFCKQPRLLTRGLTWAPSTFLEEEFVSFNTGKRAPPPGKLSAQGLVITKDCLLIDKILDFRRTPTNPPEVYIITLGEQKYGIKPHDVLSPEGQLLRVERSRPIRNPAVIWENPYSLFASNGSFRKTSKAVLVNLQFDRDGVTYCKFEMSLDGWHIRDEHADFHEKAVSISGGIIGQYSAELVVNKSFCVG